MRGSSSTTTFVDCSSFPDATFTVYSPGSTRSAPWNPPNPPPCSLACSVAASVTPPPAVAPAVAASGSRGASLTERVRRSHVTRFIPASFVPSISRMTLPSLLITLIFTFSLSIGFDFRK